MLKCGLKHRSVWFCLQMPVRVHIHALRHGTKVCNILGACGLEPTNKTAFPFTDVLCVPCLGGEALFSKFSIRCTFIVFRVSKVYCRPACASVSARGTRVS